MQGFRPHMIRHDAVMRHQCIVFSSSFDVRPAMGGHLCCQSPITDVIKFCHSSERMAKSFVGQSSLLATIRAVMFYSWTLLLSVPLFAIMLVQAPFALAFDKVRCAPPSTQPPARSTHSMMHPVKHILYDPIFCRERLRCPSDVLGKCG